MVWRRPLHAATGAALLLSSAAIEPRPEDLVEECARWAAAGECAANPAYMLAQCARSCSGVSQPAVETLAVGSEPSPPPPKVHHDGEGQCAQQQLNCSHHCSNFIDSRVAGAVAAVRQGLEARCLQEREALLQEHSEALAAVREESQEQCRIAQEEATEERREAGREEVEKCEARQKQIEKQLKEDIQKANARCREHEEHQKQRAEAAVMQAAATMQQLRECTAKAREHKDVKKLVQEEYSEKCQIEVEQERASFHRRTKQMEKREWQYHETAELAEKRANKAQEKLKRAVAPVDCKAAERRNAELAEEASEAERAREELEVLHRQHVKDAEATIQSLKDRLEAASAARQASFMEAEELRAKLAALDLSSAGAGSEAATQEAPLEEETAQEKCYRAAGRQGAAVCESLASSGGTNRHAPAMPQEASQLPAADSPPVFSRARGQPLPRLQDALAAILAAAGIRGSSRVPTGQLSETEEAEHEGHLLLLSAWLFGLAYSALGLLKLALASCEAVWGLCLACVRLPEGLDTKKTTI